LVSVGLKETGGVQVSEARRQVCHFEAFPNFVSHKPVFYNEDKLLCCLHESWMDSKTQHSRHFLLSPLERSMVKCLRSLLTQQLTSDFSTTNSRLALDKTTKLYRTEMKLKAVLSSHRKGVNPVFGSRRFYSRDYEF